MIRGSLSYRDNGACATPGAADMQGTTALLAAGAASRMKGRDKLLETVSGQPLLRLLAKRALDAGWPVVVTLPPGRPDRRAALADLPLTLLDVPDAATGMAASFRCLSRSVAGPLLVMLGDMPEIDAADLRGMIAAYAARPDRPLRATTAGGTPGQPVLFPGRLVPAMADLSGDEGARRLLDGEDVHHVPLPADRAVTDLDTKEAWDAWRARTTTPR